VLGGVASIAGTAWTFGTVGAASLALAAWAAATPASRPERPQPVATLVRALRDRPLLLAFWFVVLPALLFGTLGVLAPLRLAQLGWGSVAIGAVYLCSAALESANNVVLGRVSDRRGPFLPIRAGLLASAALALLLPLPDRAIVLAVLVVFASVAFGTFFTPGMTLLTHMSEQRGLDYGYTFALVNLAWAPGQTAGAAAGGALAQATRDAVPYVALAAICALTLGVVWRTARSTASTARSAPESSVS
jgi:predicted MFS family arabinose efflux permease